MDGLVPVFDEDAARVADVSEGWTPSEDQRTALATLLGAFRLAGVYTLTGSAGSGKTTLMKAILRRLDPAQWEVKLLAPTWRAAGRLREAVGRQFNTSSIHRAVYGTPVTKRRCECQAWTETLMEPQEVAYDVDPEGKLTLAEQDGRPVVREKMGGTAPRAASPRAFLPRYVCGECGSVFEDATSFPQQLVFELRNDGGEGADRPFLLVVVDEASMVPPKVALDVHRAFGGDRTRILYVGDANQLPYIVDPSDPQDAVIQANREILPNLQQPTAALHKIHRQAEGNPVLALAHTLRVEPEMSTVRYPFPFRLPGIHVAAKVSVETVADWAAPARREGRDIALIAKANKTRAEVNRAVRTRTGAFALGCGGFNVIPGDRLLARGNGGGVFNGEVWVVSSVTRVTSVVNDAGRAPVRHPHYEHDRILGGGVVVLSVDAALAGDYGRRASVVLVCPAFEDRPSLESDLILMGAPPDQARQRMRETARAWKDEYGHWVEALEPEWLESRKRAEQRRVACANWDDARTRGELRHALHRVDRVSPNPAVLAQVDAQITQGRFDRQENRAGVLDALYSDERDVAIDCESTLAYAIQVYGAVNYSDVAVFDFGECLTGHAMQGSQAETVGVIFDRAFWAAWSKERREALQWAYTAVTRTTRDLALFSLASPKQ
jgi:energy-coupling factor transporter ATP-binding protein EcfA2